MTPFRSSLADYDYTLAEALSHAPEEDHACSSSFSGESLLESHKESSSPSEPGTGHG